KGVGAAEDGDVRPAAGAGPGDHVGLAVAVHVAGGHVDAGGKARVVGKKTLERGAGLAADDEDVGPAAGPGPADDVRDAVAVGVAGRDADAAGEAHVVGEEVVQHRVVLAAVDGDVGAAAGVRDDNDVGKAVAVH